MTDTKFAFFDFDDTLAKGDSILPYLCFCIQKRLASWRVLPISLMAYIRWRLHPSDATEAKQASLAFLKGRSVDEMDHVAREFFRRKQLRRVFAQGEAELQRLKSEGYHILVVSASPDAYMRVLPELLPIDTVLSTRCLADEEGRYTGIVERNCKGPEKVERILAYLQETQQSIDPEHSCAYGDSLSDAPMLRLTQHPILVNPHKKLAALFPDAPRLVWR